MDSNFSLLIIIVLLTTSWYYYTKYKEYEKENHFLQNNVNKTNMENSNYRTRIKDLQKYKNDVSKTFKILDTELTNINNHVEKSNTHHFQLATNPINSSVNELTSQSIPGRVNLLTPDMLNNLIDNMNQEFNFFTPSTGNNNNNNIGTPTTYPTVPNSYQSPADIYNTYNQQDQQQSQEDYPSQTQEDHQPQPQVQLQDQQQTQEDYHQTQDQQQTQEEYHQTQDQLQQQLQEQEQQEDINQYIQHVSNETPTLGSSILRSMSFPNLPNAYQRLMIPISDTIIGRRTLVTSNDTTANGINGINGINN
jgi:hypothetical protein